MNKIISLIIFHEFIKNIPLCGKMILSSILFIILMNEFEIVLHPVFFLLIRCIESFHKQSSGEFIYIYTTKKKILNWIFIDTFRIVIVDSELYWLCG